MATEGKSYRPLLGTDPATVDKKGRILLSVKKRERLGDPFALMLGEAGCLIAYPQDVWEDLLAEIYSYKAINVGRQEYTRLLLGNADDEIRFDAQNRFVVPSRLRDLAGLKEHVMLVGCGDRLEIWDRDQYDRSVKGLVSDEQRQKRLEEARKRMKEGEM